MGWAILSMASETNSPLSSDPSFFFFANSFGYSEIRPLDYYENDDAECIMKILGTDFEWFNFEDGFELQMSIDGGEFEPFHLID